MTQATRVTLITAAMFALAILLAIPAFAQEQRLSEADVAVAPATRQAVQSVIGDQLDAFTSGDHDRAYTHAAPNIKQVFNSVERFISMVQRGYPMVYSPQAHAFGRSLTLNGEVYQEVIFTDGDGKQWQGVYTLRQQEDGSWKITGVKINPYKGAAV